MPELRFFNGVLLARAVEVLLPLAKEGIINYSPEELSLVVSEPSSSLKTALRIKSSGFTLFDCNINSSARVDLEDLHNQLKRSTGEDALSIYGGDGNYIRFQYHNTSTEDSLYSETILTQNYNDNMDTNEFQYDYEVVAEIRSSRFRSILTRLQQLGPSVLMTVEGTRVKFKVEAQEIILSEVNDECAIRSAGEGSFFSSMLNLKHVGSLRSASLLSRKVFIHISDKFNCMLSYPVAEGCFIRFYFPEENFLE